jgi:hypothetical protein
MFYRRTEPVDMRYLGSRHQIFTADILIFKNFGVFKLPSGNLTPMNGISANKPENVVCPHYYQLHCKNTLNICNAVDSNEAWTESNAQ